MLNRLRNLRRFRIPGQAAAILAGDAEGDPDAVLMRLDPDLVRYYVSPSVRKVLGYAADELVGAHPRSVIYPEDWPRIRPLFDLARLSPEPVRDTHRVRHKDGRLLWMEGRYAALVEGGFVVLLRVVGRCRGAS